MVGLGILIRLLRKLLGKPLENTGALPTRYYLHQILTSLDQDDIGRSVKLLKISKKTLMDRKRWEFVRQQVLFRCRILIEKHGRRIRSMESRLDPWTHRKKRPWKWLWNSSAEMQHPYQEALTLEKHAHALLKQYEEELRSI